MVDGGQVDGTIRVTATPVWTPDLTVGDGLRLRFESNVGGAIGGGSTYRRWRIDRLDDQQPVAAYVDGEITTMVDDLFVPEILAGRCPVDCDGFDSSERVALSFDGVELQDGSFGQASGFDIWVERAVAVVCPALDAWEGFYTFFVAG